MERKNILIRNCTILPMTAGENDPVKYYTGNIGIAGGEIVFASPDSSELDVFTRTHGQGKGAEETSSDILTVIDGRKFIAMPGLINLHNHVSMALMRSYADDLPLMQWLNDKIWPFEAKLTPDDIYLGAQLGIAEMLLGGTTTFVDMYWYTDRVAQAVEETGIRAVVCPTFFDNGLENSIRETEESITKFNGKDNGRIQVRIAPHAPYTNAPETLREVVALGKKHGVGIHTHLSETRDEVKIIQEKYGKSPTAYLEDHGIFELPTLAVHCVHLSDREIETLARYNVSVGHNPQSNMKLASGIAPVKEMLARGINVGIGTDGPASNNDLDLWDEMRTASLLQKVAKNDPCALSAYQTLQMVTVNGAKAIGMEGRLGQITPGARADILLIDAEKPHLYPRYDLVSNLVYCGKSSDVDTVIVDGRILVESRQLIGVDTQKLCQQAEKRAKELIQK